ncbi:anti-sigma factor [Kineococcus rhizosphaerae]|uniref:Anti-sigma-K factor rskA n=1 Tax=Kineococcus rhizosphaerae TaxID=559628 RepID=A0A2T0R2T7_9ACTN|nr:anti-sigma factor [Kineococcus rhizosphaerae]PRY14081.1 anti-sigma-K factor rskA [Kineococcus rhizosphaerae]
MTERTAAGQPTAHLDEDEALLAALGDPLPPAAEEHLAGCARCGQEVAGWARLAAARAADDVTPGEPSEDTWARIAAEVGFTGATVTPLTTVPAPDPAPDLRPAPAPVDLAARRGRRERGVRGTRLLRRWPLAAAAVLGLVAGVAGTRWADAPDPAPQAVRPTVVSATTLRPLTAGDAGAGGTAQVTDEDGAVHLHLALHDVPSPREGYLEVWLLDADGGLVSLGALAGDDVTLALPGDVDLGRFDVVDVSREPLDGNPGHSSDSVLRGTLSAV